MKQDLIELYSNYFLSSYGQTTTTGLSQLLDGAFSHDQVTQTLSRNEFTSQTLWRLVKPVVRKVKFSQFGGFAWLWNRRDELNTHNLCRHDILIASVEGVS